MRLLPVAAVAVALLLPGTAHAAVAQPKTDVTYDASAVAIANPGRGFMTYTETHLGDDYTPLVADELAQAKRDEARSVVFRIFYLEKYQSVDTIPAADLALIKADFVTARAAGVKLVIRFAYTSIDDQDAPKRRILKHIAQLKPILIGQADVIAAIQAGFIGQWGEWYYSHNFLADPSAPGRVTNIDWTARRQVLAALLAASSSMTPVQVRTPQIKRRLYPNGNSSPRIGVHDDCFLAGTDDSGTYLNDDDPAWLAKQSASVLVGGETCEISDRSGWDNADREMAAYHWTYLNSAFNTDVLASWGADGLAAANNKLGYRFRLVKATLTTGALPGNRTRAWITVVNDGYAAPVQQRPVQLVLSSDSRTQVVPIDTDVRAWSPGRFVTMVATFAAPTVEGDYSISLNLPDPSRKLAATQNADYAIRMANENVWDAVHGWNTLGATLTVARRA